LWFATVDGLVKYFPDKIPPQTFITYKPDNVLGVAATVFTFDGIDTETPKEKLVYSWALQNNQAVDIDNWLDFTEQIYCEIRCPFNGSYTFFVKARDEDGNEDQSPANYRFTVDTSAPITIINSPASDETVSGKVPVIGTAFDDTSIIKDFKHYWLDYAKGESIEIIKSSDWKILNDTLTAPVLNDTLTVWDTADLCGSTFLRLSAADTLGHIRNFIVRLNVVETLSEISRIQGGTIQNLQNEIRLYIPPGSLEKDALIYINPGQVTKDSLQQNNEIKYSNMIYNIGPDTVVFQKPVTLTFLYNDSDIIELNEKKLLLMRLDDSALCGGFVNPDKNIIQTTVKKLGMYVLVEDNTTRSARAAILDFDCQPQIFSPTGTGFSETTNISFSLTTDSEISIKIYNLAGRLVCILLHKMPLKAGNKSIEWDGRDYNGNICPSDLYIVTLESEKQVKTKTVMILDKAHD